MLRESLVKYLFDNIHTFRVPQSLQIPTFTFTSPENRRSAPKLWTFRVHMRDRARDSVCTTWKGVDSTCSERECVETFFSVLSFPVQTRDGSFVLLRGNRGGRCFCGYDAFEVGELSCGCSGESITNDRHITTWNSLFNSSNVRAERWKD